VSGIGLIDMLMFVQCVVCNWDRTVCIDCVVVVVVSFLFPSLCVSDDQEKAQGQETALGDVRAGGVFAWESRKKVC
jgi:hypothetical protein